MTGRKVTRRASMRRKSMRSSSASRSVESKSPRSINSEPFVSRNASFNSSSDKLDSGLIGSMASLPANNSSERLAKAQEKVMSNPVVIDNYSATALSSSEQLADQFAAVKIADSKENLVDVVARSESKASLNDFPAKNASKGSIDHITKNNNSKGSITDLAKNRSTASLNKSEAILNQSNTEIAAVEFFKEEANKSSDELVAVSLNEAKEAKEVTDVKETPEPVANETSTSTPVAVQSTEAPDTIQAEGEEESKKSCLAQKAAKCRCVIS